MHFRRAVKNEIVLQVLATTDARSRWGAASQVALLTRLHQCTNYQPCRARRKYALSVHPSSELVVASCEARLGRNQCSASPLQAPPSEPRWWPCRRAPQRACAWLARAECQPQRRRRIGAGAFCTRTPCSWKGCRPRSRQSQPSSEGTWSWRSFACRARRGRFASRGGRTVPTRQNRGMFWALFGSSGTLAHSSASATLARDLASETLAHSSASATLAGGLASETLASRFIRFIMHTPLNPHLYRHSTELRALRTLRRRSCSSLWALVQQSHALLQQPLPVQLTHTSHAARNRVSVRGAQTRESRAVLRPCQSLSYTHGTSPDS